MGLRANSDSTICFVAAHLRTISVHVATQVGSTFGDFAAATIHDDTCADEPESERDNFRHLCPHWPSTSFELHHEAILQTWHVTESHHCWADKLDTVDHLPHMS